MELNNEHILCGIYKITSPAGWVYVGQSTDIFKRWTKQYQQPSGKIKCKQQPGLYNTLVKYGWSAHTFEILELCDQDVLNEKERYWISYFDSYKNGLNCTIGGEGTNGCRWSAESKKRASESKRRLYDGGYKSPLIGKPFSEERKKKMSEVFTGLLIGNKNPFFGKRHSEESKKKIGQKSVGRYFSKEVRQRASNRNSGMGNPMYGVKLYGEKNGMYGKKHKQESIAAMSKIILNVETGVFYFGLQDAAASIGVKSNTLAKKFWRNKNYPFIYA